MRIACLGWGSLVWDADGLPLRGWPRPWHQDGPSLSVEFARKSKDGRITLVITGEEEGVPVLWAELDAESGSQARQALCDRERTTLSKIGLIEVGDGGQRDVMGSRIEAWAATRDFGAAVWTALGPTFETPNGMPTEEVLVSYLKTLSGDARFLAERYIRQTPKQIVTPYRKVIEADRELGWGHADFSAQFIRR